jgi:hypothetical protein
MGKHADGRVRGQRVVQRGSDVGGQLGRGPRLPRFIDVLLRKFRI